MQNSIKSVKNTVESVVLEHLSTLMSDLMGLNKTHFGNIRYNDELELVSVFPEDFLEVGSL